MASPKPYEAQLLAPVEALLTRLTCSVKRGGLDLRLQILEASASRLGGMQLKDYFSAFEILPLADLSWLEKCGKQIATAISSISLHPALALSALSREPLPESDQRTAGAYYTDFRLAQHIAALGDRSLHKGAKVLDPASGAGALLVAVSIVACGPGRNNTAEWLANSVFAADLSANALRGARLALASLTDSSEAISQMWANWRVQDSLMTSLDTWEALAPGGFDLVVGNPPWEKVKLTRHEHLKANGSERHYGDDYYSPDSEAYLHKRKDVVEYAQSLVRRFELVRSGELDLYMPFLELSSQLLRPGGRISILVPAGLIRSKGTEALRRFLFKSGEDIEFTLLENRARFFPIDTRFKFLSLSYTRAQKLVAPSKHRLRLNHASATDNGVSITGSAKIDLDLLTAIRPDLTVPEVRNDREWGIFVAMAQNGTTWGNDDSPWHPDIAREVDMTKERPYFLRKMKNKALPVIEGRMVQGHRFGAKSYLSGTGRRAQWAPVPMGFSEVKPQFWIAPTHLSQKITHRTKLIRAGFCDITGQTNERSMMAALVQPGTVCGNKVPTIMFPKDSSEQRLFLWLGIVNSLPFDWMLRRVLTTTVNYFLLLSLPLAPMEPDSLPGRRVIKAAQALNLMDTSYEKLDLWEVADLKGEIDLEVLVSYGLGYEDLLVMLEDFPLLDRGQPAIFNEKFSTVTRDFLLLCAAKRFSLAIEPFSERVAAARKAGAIPYIPSEMAGISNIWKEPQQDA